MTVSLPIIKASAHWHLRHITAGGDPFEAREARPLDFGHWSAHRLESLSEFAQRHGEAVAIGVAIDTVYSSLVHGLPRDDARRVVDCLRELGFPLNAPALNDRHALFAGLEEFRQHLGGRLTLTMLRGAGDPIDVHHVDRHKMQQAMAEVADLAAASA
jgi:3-dehydroquinate synthase